MPRSRRNEEDDDRPENFWKGLARDAGVAVAIVALFLGALYLYAGVWPPLVVVESSSMQHGNEASSFGVIDTGDMVFQQAAPTRSSVITYLEGRANGYTTYGDFGDVIIFRRIGSATPIIHRAIMFVTLHVVTANGRSQVAADVPDITLLPTSEWTASNATGSTRNPDSLYSLTILRMGFNRDINFTFSFNSLPAEEGRAGFVTMGDNNLFEYCRLSRDHCTTIAYDPWVPRIQDIQGRARGEIPWLGLVKLTLQPTDTCCSGWGDPEAPKNSWDDLLITLVVLAALPFLLEYGVRGWTKFVSPHLPRIRWPWRRARTSDPNLEDPIGPTEDESKPPREGSFEP